MILISEWLPNPAGADAAGEWVELWNSGPAAASLSGWRLTSDSQKFFVLDGSLAPGARLVVHRKESKIALRNSDGRLALYDASGHLADKASFTGSAPEGESANRAEAGMFFAAPTPGAANAATSVAMAHDNAYPPGVPLNGAAAASGLGFIGLLLGTAVALTAAVMFILKAHEDLSQLFFQGNADARRGGS
jgi:hypothetical protein